MYFEIEEAHGVHSSCCFCKISHGKEKDLIEDSTCLSGIALVDFISSPKVLDPTTEMRNYREEFDINPHTCLHKIELVTIEGIPRLEGGFGTLVVLYYHV